MTKFGTLLFFILFFVFQLLTNVFLFKKEWSIEVFISSIVASIIAVAILLIINRKRK